MEIHDPALKYQTKMTPEAYLEWEQQQEYKHEYAEGEIIAMSGASRQHNMILSNLIGKINPFLSGKPCHIYPSDLRIYLESKTSYFYPDATIICDEPDAEDLTKDTIDHPAVIFEILSPSTETYDLGKKFFYYMQLPSLLEYITISSFSYHVRTGKRQPDNAWKFEEYTQPKDKLLIDAIQYELPLKAIYEAVVF